MYYFKNGKSLVPPSSTLEGDKGMNNFSSKHFLNKSLFLAMFCTKWTPTRHLNSICRITNSSLITLTWIESSAFWHRFKFQLVCEFLIDNTRQQIFSNISKRKIAILMLSTLEEVEWRRWQWSRFSFYLSLRLQFWINFHESHMVNPRLPKAEAYCFHKNWSNR